MPALESLCVGGAALAQLASQFECPASALCSHRERLEGLPWSSQCFGSEERTVPTVLLCLVALPLHLVLFSRSPMMVLNDLR